MHFWCKFTARSGIAADGLPHAQWNPILKCIRAFGRLHWEIYGFSNLLRFSNVKSSDPLALRWKLGFDSQHSLIKHLNASICGSDASERRFRCNICASMISASFFHSNGWTLRKKPSTACFVCKLMRWMWWFITDQTPLVSRCFKRPPVQFFTAEKPTVEAHFVIYMKNIFCRSKFGYNVRMQRIPNSKHFQ